MKDEDFIERALKLYGRVLIFPFSSFIPQPSSFSSIHPHERNVSGDVLRNSFERADRRGVVAADHERIGRAADLQWQLKDSSASATSLAAFRKAWNRGTRTNATQLRIEELGTLLAAPHKDPSAPR